MLRYLLPLLVLSCSSHPEENKLAKISITTPSGLNYQKAVLSVETRDNGGSINREYSFSEGEGLNASLEVGEYAINLHFFDENMKAIYSTEYCKNHIESFVLRSGSNSLEMSVCQDSSDFNPSSSGNFKRSGVFGGGPLYHNAETVLPALKKSGFSTLILWTIHVNNEGDLIFNDFPIVTKGEFVANVSWAERIRNLRQNSSINRVEFSVGSAGVRDFEKIEAMYRDNRTENLLNNFRVLKESLNLDAINYDDESNYDHSSTLALSEDLSELGYKITLCPYTRTSFWSRLYRESISKGIDVDGVYLQSYAGGAGNSPYTWNRYFQGLKVDIGYWSSHGRSCRSGYKPSVVSDRLSRYRNEIKGGWMWLLDDMIKCTNSKGMEQNLKDYAEAINSVLDIR